MAPQHTCCNVKGDTLKQKTIKRNRYSNGDKDYVLQEISNGNATFSGLQRSLGIRRSNAMSAWSIRTKQKHP